MSNSKAFVIVDINGTKQFLESAMLLEEAMTKRRERYELHPSKRRLGARQHWINNCPGVIAWAMSAEPGDWRKQDDELYFCVNGVST